MRMVGTGCIRNILFILPLGAEWMEWRSVHSGIWMRNKRTRAFHILNFKILQDGLHLQLLFYELAKFDGMRLKIEGALILRIVAVLAKICLEKFTPKVRRTSYHLLPVKTLVRHISQTSFFMPRSSFNVYLYSAKISISKFWSVPTWMVTLIKISARSKVASTALVVHIGGLFDVDMTP